MADQTALVVDLTPSKMVHQAQVMKVLALKLDGLSTAEARKEAGIARPTFYRWVAKTRNVQIVQQLGGQALVAAAIEAIGALPDVVAMYREAIADPEAALRDRTVAGKEIRSIVEAFAKPQPAAPPSRAGTDGDGEERPAVAPFNPQSIINLQGGGQVSMEVRVQQPPVIENPAREPAASPGSESDTRARPS